MLKDILGFGGAAALEGSAGAALVLFFANKAAIKLELPPPAMGGSFMEGASYSSVVAGAAG